MGLDHLGDHRRGRLTRAPFRQTHSCRANRRTLTDISRALRIAQRLEAGSVWINGWFLGGVQAPTGGIKDSGIGRERGLPGIRNYLQIKNVAIRL